jgi:hypothetical protein
MQISEMQKALQKFSLSITMREYAYGLWVVKLTAVSGRVFEGRSSRGEHALTDAFAVALAKFTNRQVPYEEAR